MFETHDSYKMPNFLLPAGGHIWKTVGIRFHMLWFHVQYKVTTKDDIDFGVLFLSKPQQVLDLQQQPGCEIDQLDIVSPRNKNGTERWKMEPVREIWVGNELAPMEQHKAWIYVLEDGNRYVDSCITPNENDLCDKRLVFKK